MFYCLIHFVTGTHSLQLNCLYTTRGGILITVEGDNLDAVGDPQLVTTVLIEQKNYNETFWTVSITITKISYTINSTTNSTINSTTNSTINSTINSTLTCGSYSTNS